MPDPAHLPDWYLALLPDDPERCAALLQVCRLAKASGVCFRPGAQRGEYHIVPATAHPEVVKYLKLFKEEIVRILDASPYWSKRECVAEVQEVFEAALCVGCGQHFPLTPQVRETPASRSTPTPPRRVGRADRSGREGSGREGAPCARGEGAAQGAGQKERAVAVVSYGGRSVS